MKIETNEEGVLQFTEVFNGMKLKTRAGETMSIWMRDSGFEFRYEGQMWQAKEGEVGMMKTSERGNILVDQSEKQDETSVGHGGVINLAQRNLMNMVSDVASLTKDSEE